MFIIVPSKQFKKASKKYKHQKNVLDELSIILRLLQQGEPMPEKYRDHLLIGSHIGIRECHIKPDILLLYEIDLERNMLGLVNIGSHSELFRK